MHEFFKWHIDSDSDSDKKDLKKTDKFSAGNLKKKGKIKIMLTAGAEEQDRTNVYADGRRNQRSDDHRMQEASEAEGNLPADTTMGQDENGGADPDDEWLQTQTDVQAMMEQAVSKFQRMVSSPSPFGKGFQRAPMYHPTCRARIPRVPSFADSIFAHPRRAQYTSSVIYIGRARL